MCVLLGEVATSFQDGNEVSDSLATSADATGLFSLVPAGLFGPLVSANRERHWQLLCRLFDGFFGPDAPMPPSVGFQRREITAAIERYLLAVYTISNWPPWATPAATSPPPAW